MLPTGLILIAAILMAVILDRLISLWSELASLLPSNTNLYKDYIFPIYLLVGVFFAIYAITVLLYDLLHWKDKLKKKKTEQQN